MRHGFTLIELSIVLVIIGLIVGGVLVGKDLIKAAETRSQISQIEKYQTAVATFRLKYGYLPGDIPEPAASANGFLARGGAAAQGDGNGFIQGQCGAGGCNCGFCVANGENLVFWTDLSTAGMIDGKFPGQALTIANSGTCNADMSVCFPSAKIGRGNIVYVHNGNTYLGIGGYNYFAISVPNYVNTWGLLSTPGMTPIEAYNMDSKIDDGFPQSGKVVAQYMNYTLYNFGPVWAGGPSAQGASGTGATLASTSSCYDNGGVAGQQKYTLANADALNCALSFRFIQ